MNRDVVEVFEKLKNDGIQVTLLDCSIDEDYEDDEEVFYIAFTGISDEEEINRQKELLKENKCTPDTIETWSTVEELYTTVKNELNLHREQKERE